MASKNLVPSPSALYTNPGFLPNGRTDTAGITNGTSIPPSNVRTIGDALNDKGISWTYYGGAYNAAVNLANGSTNPLDAVGQAYCASCNFASYASSIMGDAGQRALHIRDITDFFAAVTSGSLPAVSFVKPDALVDGHPATSKLNLYEAMLQKGARYARQQSGTESRDRTVHYVRRRNAARTLRVVL